MTDNKRRASIVAVMGATGAGKTSTICEALASDVGRRRLIYDPGADYGEFGEVVDRLAVIRETVMVKRAPSFSFVYRPSVDLEKAAGEFDAFCWIAFLAGDVLVVADELEDVTRSNWAPPYWSQLVRKGRKRGVRIVAASQMPAYIDKKIWSMATMVQSGRLNELEHARTVARVLMVEPAAVMALPQLHYIRRSIYAPVIEHGRIEWRDGRPHSVVLKKTPLPGQ